MPKIPPQIRRPATTARRPIAKGGKTRSAKRLNEVGELQHEDESTEFDRDDEELALLERQMAAEQYAKDQANQQDSAQDASESEQGRKARGPDWEKLKEMREAADEEAATRKQNGDTHTKTQNKLAAAFSNQVTKTKAASSVESFQKLDKLKASLAERAHSGVALEDARPAPPPPPRAAPGTALAFLNAAQDPGYYIRERPQREGGEGREHEEPEPPSEEEQALAKACEEAEAEIKAKAIVGVSRVYAANDHEDRPVVVIETVRGLGYGGLCAIPDRVGEFETITRIYYPNLPLKRDRPLV